MEQVIYWSANADPKYIIGLEVLGLSLVALLALSIYHQLRKGDIDISNISADN